MAGECLEAGFLRGRSLAKTGREKVDAGVAEKEGVEKGEKGC